MLKKTFLVKYHEPPSSVLWRAEAKIGITLVQGKTAKVTTDAELLDPAVRELRNVALMDTRIDKGRYHICISANGRK